MTCSVPGLAQLFLYFCLLVFSFMFTNSYHSLSEEGRTALEAGQVGLCLEDSWWGSTLATQSWIVSLYCNFWIKAAAGISALIVLLSAVIRLSGLFGFLCCPEALFRCRKRMHNIPLDNYEFLRKDLE